MPRLIRRSLPLLLMYPVLVCWMMFGSTGCGGPRDGDAQARQIQERERTRQLAQQVSQLQQQVAALDRQLVDLRAENDRKMNEIMAASQALAARLQQVRGALPPGGPSSAAQFTPAAPAAVEAPVPVEDENAGGSVWFSLFRLILVLILVAAILVIVRIFMGRWNDEEDEDEDLDEAAGDEEIANDMGTIRVTPEVQRELRRENPAEPPAADKAD